MLGCLLSRSRSSVTLCLLIYFPGLMPTGIFISTGFSYDVRLYFHNLKRRKTKVFRFTPIPVRYVDITLHCGSHSQFDFISSASIFW
jgi:hypothetical protein